MPKLEWFKKADEFLVDTTYGLLLFVLYVGLLIVVSALPFAIITALSVELYNKEFVEALKVIGIGVIAFYVARALLKVVEATKNSLK